MLELTLLLLQINILILIILSMIWNKAQDKLPIKRIISIILITNIMVIFVVSITEFSFGSFIEQASSTFNTAENWYRFAVPVMSLCGGVVIVFFVQQLMLLQQHSKKRYIFILGFFILATLILWLPFGFETVGVKDTWNVKSFLVTGNWYNSNASKATELFTRLSIIFTSTLAHFIDDNGFIGYNIIHMILFSLKGIILFGILKKLSFSDYLSFIIALLFMFYPTPETVLSLRNFVIVSGVILFLLSVYVFLTYLTSPTRINLLTFFVVMFMAVSSNEYAFLHTISFPLLIVYKEKLWRKRFYLTGLWYLLPVWYVSHFYTTARFASDSPYGLQHLEATTTFSTEIIAIFSTIARTFKVLLVDDWIHATSFIGRQYLIPVVLIALCASFILYRLIPQKTEDNPKIQLGWGIVLGTVIIILAAFIFSVFPDRRESDWRIYAIGSSGASFIVILSILLIIYSISKQYYTWIATSIFIILLALSYNASLFNHQEQVELAQPKRNLLEFVTQLEYADPNGTWVYLFDMDDDTFKNSLQQFTGARYRDGGINIFLDKGSIKTSYVCNPDSAINYAQCTVNEKRIRMELWKNDIQYEDVVFLWIEEDGSTRILDTFPYDFFDIDTPIDSYNPYNYIKLK